ncbi:MAG: translation initiation factor IF-2 [Enterobacteriaceae bacterium PSmelAO3-2]|nr:MAG: translation initiation factor IF-2 [Enterobacteriaceae bacterium PSmelAO3-2]WMC17863.1 MAG: translation initiation factor IF-2 [Enterobacteriaceae bacterium PSmelAO3-1]WMC18067.1 MAG: translation initiation factor IF-2 [Enterobacteriaceae bacterium PSmelAO1]
MFIKTKVEIFKKKNIYYNKIEKFLYLINKCDKKNINNINNNNNIIYFKKHKFNTIIFENISLLKLSNIINFKYDTLIYKLIKLKVIMLNEYLIIKKNLHYILKFLSNKIIIYNKYFIIKKNIKNFFKKRSPIITIMGHVNHGKTTLLDYIRSTKLVSQELGKITQHIGIYNIKTKYGFITFFDTPGHEAFTSMRKRGIKNSDIIVLVIAANDGIMPQTIEIIKYSQKLNIPLIIAINKIDKIDKININININNIKNELSQYKIISEEWGGEIQFVNISAKIGTGVDNLINAILLQTEILELKEKKKALSKGIIIESYFDKSNGLVVTMLLKQGILKKNDIIIYNSEYNSIKSIFNIFGKKKKLIKSSIPIEITGFNNIPKIGDKVLFLNNDNIYKDILNTEKQLNNKNEIKNIFKYNISNLNKINIILKSDALGYCEVISNELLKLSNEKIKINIISLGVGNISENDSILALNNNAIILGFNVYIEYSVNKMINFENLDIRYYSVIYKLINDIKKEINLLTFKNNNKKIGLANILNVFKFEKLGLIAGCLITQGLIKYKSKIKIIRNNKIIYIGKIDSLKYFKKNVKEVNNGMECGIYIKNFNNFKIKDKIEIF